MDYRRMLYVFYSVCELETHIFLAGDLALIEKVDWVQKVDIAKIERMLKALTKSFENKPLNP